MSYKIAKIIANDLIHLYIEKQLYNLASAGDFINQGQNMMSLNWTANKLT